jgi:hypothetical protein
MKLTQLFFALIVMALFMGAYSQVLAPEDESFLETAETNKLSRPTEHLNEDNDDDEMDSVDEEDDEDDEDALDETTDNEDVSLNQI